MLRWVILVVIVVSLTAAATIVVQYLPDAEDTRKVPVVEVTGPQPKILNGWRLDVGGGRYGQLCQ